MTNESPQDGTRENGTHANGKSKSVNFGVKAGLAQMLKGGVIMDVVNAEQVFIPSPVQNHRPGY
jgi:hypothetical protein